MVGQVFVDVLTCLQININNNGATLNWTTSTADVNLNEKTGMTKLMESK